MNFSSIKLVSLAALGATILPSILSFFGLIGPDAVNWITLAGTAIWFVSAPAWIDRKLSPDSLEVEL